MTDTPAVAHAHDELIIDSVPGLVAILNPAGEVEAVNDQILEYCGEPLQAMKHWGTNGIVHAEDVPRIAPAFAHAITTGVPYDFDARIRRFDGIYRWFQVRGRPLGDLDGSIARWYVLRFTGAHQAGLAVLSIAVFLLSTAPLELQRRIVNDLVSKGSARAIFWLASAVQPPPYT